MEPSRVLIVTGADAKFLAMAGALWRSLADAGWRGGFRICDFGLTPTQAAALAQAGLLAPRPAGLAADIHPFFHKASLVDYVAGFDFDLLVWIDCDIIAVDDPTAAVADLAQIMATCGVTAAVCPDVGVASIAEACGRLAMAPFEAALAQRGIDPGRPYLNTGVVAVNRREALAAWRDAAFSTPVHALFEQNAFNLLAHAGVFSTALLPPRRWNVHGPLLDGVEIGADGARVGGERAFLLHATSAETSRHEVFEGAARLAGGVFHGQLKLFRHPGARAWQFDALNRWSLTPAGRAVLDQTDQEADDGA